MLWETLSVILKEKLRSTGMPKQQQQQTKDKKMKMIKQRTTTDNCSS